MPSTSPLQPQCVRDRTLPRMLQRQAARQPEARFLTMGSTQWTHADAVRAAGARGAALHATGVTKSDRVALMCGNRIEALEVFTGCGWIGAVAVPINTAAKGPQIQYCIENSGAKLLVIEAAFLERLEGVDFSQTALETIWVIPDRACGAQDRAHISGVRVVAYPAAGSTVPAENLEPSDTLAILYTSGTTGPAKGVICSHGHYYLFGFNSVRMLGVTEGDVLSTTLPLFHINALNTFAQASITGCQVVIHEKFSASGFWPASRACGATVVYLLGAMIPMLLAQPVSGAERTHNVRVGLGGGAPGTTAEDFKNRTGVLLVDGYASTETSVVISTSPGVAGLGAMGWLKEGFQARVADAFDLEVQPGEAGELLLRADEPFAFASGYFNMADKTVEAWRNLWFHTGDRVVREADGSFRFVDRMKDAMRRRGENISSYEVEQALLTHPDIAQAAAFPVQSELGEDEVMVSVVLHADRRIELSGLVMHCERRLPHFAVPRYFDVVIDLPRTENGKIQKFKLREAGVTATTWERPGASQPRRQSNT
ncbi:ATP-dependent acyl-CoA ligase [Variovorax sp. RT4R15]|uniref:ATP-dependent acyl-CoA ligase n=1 Tax=Variovorax sp. RT4R15 TaxID=3443737 RepID=UPI003F476412